MAHDPGALRLYMEIRAQSRAADGIERAHVYVDHHDEDPLPDYANLEVCHVEGPLDLMSLARAARVPLCRCVNVEVGTFTRTVLMEDPFKRKVVGIDLCIATEVAELWWRGIETMASCCGHGKFPPNVCVAPEFDDLMRELGFKLWDEESTVLKVWLLESPQGDVDVRS